MIKQKVTIPIMFTGKLKSSAFQCILYGVKTKQSLNDSLRYRLWYMMQFPFMWADFRGRRTPQLNVKEGNSIHGVTNNQFVTRVCDNCSFTMLPNPVFYREMVTIVIA